jgi:hypothetical protein
MMEDWVKEKGVVLRGGGLDESPHVYRRLPDVLSAQKGPLKSSTRFGLSSSSWRARICLILTRIEVRLKPDTTPRSG